MARKKKKTVKSKASKARNTKAKSQRKKVCKNPRVSGVAKAGKKGRKRASAKLPALQKELYSKIKQEYFDLDYIKTLSPKEKRWLNKFMNEYLNANMNTTKVNLHSTKEKRRQVFNANNARNRDIYSIAKATGRVWDEETREESYDPTDDIIDMIDLSRETEN